MERGEVIPHSSVVDDLASLFLNFAARRALVEHATSEATRRAAAMRSRSPLRFFLNLERLLGTTVGNGQNQPHVEDLVGQLPSWVHKGAAAGCFDLDEGKACFRAACETTHR